MTIASLTDVLTPAQEQGYGVAGLVVLGWEDACAFVEAADDLGFPVVLQAGPNCRNHTPVSLLGPMFRHLAEQASVPVVCHIDHATTVEECQLGIDYGFTSVIWKALTDLRLSSSLIFLSSGFTAIKSVLYPIFSAFAIDSSVVPVVEHCFLNSINFGSLL